MRNLEIVLDFKKTDVPKCLSAMLAHCGSLNANRYAWGDLIVALGLDPHYQIYKERAILSVEEAASRIVACIPPEEIGADVSVGTHCASFTTPGGVVVTLENYNDNLLLSVSFGRDSTYLAVCMASSLFQTSGCRDHLPLLREAIEVAPE